MQVNDQVKVKDDAGTEYDGRAGVVMFSSADGVQVKLDALPDAPELTINVSDTVLQFLGR